MAGGDSALALQAAILAKMGGLADLTAIVSTRIYTRPPANPVKPYVSMGPMQVLREIADEYDGGDVRFQVDGWSAQQTSTKEVMQMGAAIGNGLQGAELALADNQRLVSIEIEQTRYLTDPDGLTQHAVVIGRARTEPSA